MSLTKTLLVFGIATATLAGSTQLKTGDGFPDLTKFKLEGQVPDSLAGKVVIVDFWASWCSPCKASFPVLNELQKTYGDKVVVIGVNVDDKRTEMDGFLKQHAADFTVVRDADKQLVAQANINTMPTSFVLDGAGKVRSIHSGFHGDTTKKQYIAEIDDLLKVK
jgi:thiol-disulfide isomerase/thioredoxin